MPNPRGQIVKREASGGLSVDEYRVMLFRWNEHQWKHDPNLVLDDDELSEFMCRAFPDRTWSKMLKNIPRARSIYNRGRLRCQKKTPPPERSYRYERFVGGVRQWSTKQFRKDWPTKKLKKQRRDLDGVLPFDVTASKFVTLKKRPTKKGSNHGKVKQDVSRRSQQGQDSGSQRQEHVGSPVQAECQEAAV